MSFFYKSQTKPVFSARMYGVVMIKIRRTCTCDFLIVCTSNWHHCLVMYFIWCQSLPLELSHMSVYSAQHLVLAHAHTIVVAVFQVKVKAFPYSIPSVGPGADPGVQAVSRKVTVSHPPGGRLPLLSARPAVTSPAAEAHRGEQLSQGCYAVLPRVGFEPATYWLQVQRSTRCTPAPPYKVIRPIDQPQLESGYGYRKWLFVTLRFSSWHLNDNSELATHAAISLCTKMSAAYMYIHCVSKKLPSFHLL